MTNDIESFNAQLRKVIKTLGHFIMDGAASHAWKEASSLAIRYEDRRNRLSY